MIFKDNKNRKLKCNVTRFYNKHIKYMSLEKSYDVYTRKVRQFYPKTWGADDGYAQVRNHNYDFNSFRNTDTEYDDY